MALIVCIAGLPQEAVNEIKREPARYSGEKGNEPIVRSLRGELSYRHGMSDDYLSDIYKRVSALPDLEDVGIVIAYASHADAGTDRFVRAFFPFAISVPCEPFYYEAAPKGERRERMHSFLDTLVSRLDAARDCANQVKDELSGKIFSPLTLPIRNFQSNVLRPILEDLYINLWQTDDPAAEISSKIQVIEAAHPRARIKYDERNHPSDPNKPYFLDDRGLRFKSPGNDLHGLLTKLEGDHNRTCVLASRIRLGGPIVARMHYDCDYFPKQAVNDEFMNCHDQPESAKKTTHANIAPSDAVW